MNCCFQKQQKLLSNCIFQRNSNSFLSSTLYHLVKRFCIMLSHCSDYSFKKFSKSNNNNKLVRYVLKTKNKMRSLYGPTELIFRNPEDEVEHFRIGKTHIKMSSCRKAYIEDLHRKYVNLFLPWTRLVIPSFMHLPTLLLCM